ncbi:MAG: bifunctional folylpolyglutamate synthase/dihydrofolate synthase [Treponema sp.]|nr:bifunctional folylpolyglutamate synthase/dihydrofolate synthase [Candidatus Treponema caballi]
MSEKRAVEVLDEWLDSYLNFEKLPQKNMFWLDTIKFLCNRFGNPQESYKSFHVAGSKGKGSVSTFISSILEEAGFPCGLYTSPHILDLSERIGSAHGPLPESVYENALRLMVCRVESIIPEQLPNDREITWFELITLYAFLCFREAGLPWAVFETGLGGRLDATNVLLPQMCVLTPIELEHTEFLGNTICAIAGEKAGIIKAGVPVCSSAQKKEAEDVFRAKAEEFGSDIVFINEVLESMDYSLKKDENSGFIMQTSFTFNRFFSRPLSACLHLLGRVQAENAALAALSVKRIFPDLDESIIERGLEKARLPGRCEITVNPYDESGKSIIVLDGAHTVNSLSGILDTFSRIIGKGTKADLLFACASDKDMTHMVKLLLPDEPLFESITLTRPGGKKHSDLDTLADAFMKQRAALSSGNDVHYAIEKDYKSGIHNALKEAAERHVPLLVTGSFYLVSEVKQAMQAL